MKHFVIIVLVFFLAVRVIAQPAEISGLIESGNQSYATSDYTAAVGQYEAVIRAGFESAGLYFNLGNAYFKLNDNPSAILFYEKALKLDPTDENIRFNLSVANSRIADKIEPLPEFFLKGWWRSARDLFSSDRWAKTGIVIFFLVLASVSFFIISRSVTIRKIAFWSGLLFLAFMTLSFIFSYNGYHDYSRQSSAIIFTPTVTVKSSPSAGSVDLFVIHEGTKVFITDKVEDWSEVRLTNGSVGWIKAETFRLI
jgi:tetratricopeptide (TPR) repeat protein